MQNGFDGLVVMEIRGKEDGIMGFDLCVCCYLGYKKIQT
jgi:hypothetical protein